MASGAAMLAWEMPSRSGLSAIRIVLITPPPPPPLLFMSLAGAGTDSVASHLGQAIRAASPDSVLNASEDTSRRKRIAILAKMLGVFIVVYGISIARATIAIPEVSFEDMNCSS